MQVIGTVEDHQQRKWPPGRRCIEIDIPFPIVLHHPGIHTVVGQPAIGYIRPALGDRCGAGPRHVEEIIAVPHPIAGGVLVVRVEDVFLRVRVEECVLHIRIARNGQGDRPDRLCGNMPRRESEPFKIFRALIPAGRIADQQRCGFPLPDEDRPAPLHDRVPRFLETLNQ